MCCQTPLQVQYILLSLSCSHGKLLSAQGVDKMVEGERGGGGLVR